MSQQFCEKTDVVLLFLKAFSWETNLWVTLDDLTVKNYPSLWEVLFYFWERKKVFCFIPLYMHIIDNNYIVTDDAGSCWLVFVKAKMWFGSGRDSASLSSFSRSLSLLCVWFCPPFFKILVWSPDLWFKLYFCLIFLFFLPHQLQGKVNKKKKYCKKRKWEGKAVFNWKSLR